MLSKVRSHDGTTVTIYSANVAVGGLTSAKNGHWYWALFGVNDTGLDKITGVIEFGGMEQDADTAFAALARQWQNWVDAAGLTVRTHDYIN